MCVLALNESKIGMPILLKSILEASVDIQFILTKKENYRRIEIEDALLWKGIIECVYKGNKYVKYLRDRQGFEEEAKENTERIKNLQLSRTSKANVSTKFKNTIFADAHDSIYAALCSHAHNGKSAQKERHITTHDEKSRVNMFRETNIEEYEHYLQLASCFIYESVLSINEAFKYGLNNEVDELREIFNNN
jgi:hypothetical protein